MLESTPPRLLQECLEAPTRPQGSLLGRFPATRWPARQTARISGTETFVRVPREESPRWSTIQAPLQQCARTIT
jgi:hypothetical protein